jgi:hypothetical protein
MESSLLFLCWALAQDMVNILLSLPTFLARPVLFCVDEFPVGLQFLGMAGSESPL